VMVRPSQAESIKGKDVNIGEERKLRMVKPKSPEAGRWKRKEKSNPLLIPSPPSTSSWLNINRAETASGSSKIGHSELEKLDPVSLSQAGSSAGGRSSNGK
jgi:hypothetical protein